MTRCASERNFPKTGLGWTAPDPVVCRLETQRLLIRSYTLEDAPEMLAVIRASLDHLLPWMPWAQGHTCLAFTTRYIADQMLAQTGGEKFDGIGVGIFDTAGGDFLGGTGVHDIRRDTASCEIGYWIRHDRVGRGYATEACARILSWAMADQNAGGLGLRRVRIYCSSANIPSSRIPERLGLTREVRQRQDYYVDGHGPTDRLGWGVMCDEWDCVNHRRVTPAPA